MSTDGVAVPARRDRPRLPSARRCLAVALVAGALAAAATWPVAPRPPALGEKSTGDAALAAEVRDLLGDDAGLGGLAVALVEDGAVTTAALGHADAAGRVPLRADTPMEIGSLAKPLTGMLLADLAADGVVAVDQPAAEALSVDDAGLAAVTLEDLATHRAGPLDEPPRVVANLVGTALTGANLYRGMDAERVVDAAAGRDLAPRSEAAYSNLGVSVLGQALARADGQAYDDLLDARLLAPLGMADTAVAVGPDDLPAGAATGWVANGVRPAAWTGEGYAPSGVGPWSTAEDLARLIAAILDETAPGMGALEPLRAFADGADVGMGWIVPGGDGDVVTHNGGTAGFASFVAVDRAARRGVALLASTDFLMAPPSVDPVGWALLGDELEAERADRAGLDRWALGLVAVGLALFVAPTVLLAARRRRRRRPMDRLDVVGGLLPVAFGLALLRTLGGWQLLPGPAWSLAVAVGAGALAACAVGWRDLPVAAGPRPWLRWASAAARALVAAGLVALVWP